ncbi:MAG TPA: TetR/AcrR family transcriptional regulator [Acetobacteraceae bacterium]|nr:TetR/AcrR family transcriptional regulator [Acetobacteraceae bacterium]
MTDDTRAKLLTEAEDVVRRVGYAGFSYADLAERVKIRKPSIHHHFRTKEDIGAALVEAYTVRFKDSLADIVVASPRAPQRLQAYAGLYRMGLEAGQGCLCGVLASELDGLPDRVRLGVRRFFKLNSEWLEVVLAEGQATGSIRADADARSQAAAVLAGLEGAMLVGRALDSIAAFDAAARAIIAGVTGRTSL